MLFVLMKNQSAQMVLLAVCWLLVNMVAVVSQTQFAAVIESTVVRKDTPVMFQQGHATEEAVWYQYYKRLTH